MDTLDPDKIELINTIFKKYDGKFITNQTCEVCFESKNLLICENCKNYYHIHCSKLNFIPVKFFCSECKENFRNLCENTFETISIYDPKPSTNKLVSFEYKQRSSKKESFTANIIKKKRERDSGIFTFSQSFSYKDNLELDSSIINKDKVY